MSFNSHTWLSSTRYTVLLLLLLLSHQVSLARYLKYSIKVNKVIDYAMSMVGTPYKWGGNGPDGYDCSGFIQEVLASVGQQPPIDKSSQELFEFYAKISKPLARHRPRAGSLVFYGSGINHITHVDFAIDAYRVVGAIGGNMATRTVEQARAKGAFVKVRPINYRPDIVAVLFPNYHSIGLQY